ncbi:hypothetical protein KDK95_19545 [Actinospica sp. MGRD01-02]|uniref:Uncharacterized protein n=1 Tax=Actinospica acidithermotolerans TaxID=2828514 RepID=A0A941E915_9ACTN|nr:hypothetical protein [Actinospica acidithermotolerans]MBR7828515.1 hypothetical protein [Actinospica acidithermotolerans]
MRGAGAGAGSEEERGRRPDYLKSDTEIADRHADRTKAAVAAHLDVCGASPLPLDQNRLVCAKCGSILKIDDAQAPALLE